MNSNQIRTYLQKVRETFSPSTFQWSEKQAWRKVESYFTRRWETLFRRGLEALSLEEEADSSPGYLVFTSLEEILSNLGLDPLDGVFSALQRVPTILLLEEMTTVLRPRDPYYFLLDWCKKIYRRQPIYPTSQPRQFETDSNWKESSASLDEEFFHEEAGQLSAQVNLAFKAEALDLLTLLAGTEVSCDNKDLNIHQIRALVHSLMRGRELYEIQPVSVRQRKRRARMIRDWSVDLLSFCHLTQGFQPMTWLKANDLAKDYETYGGKPPGNNYSLKRAWEGLEELNFCHFISEMESHG